MDTSTWQTFRSHPKSMTQISVQRAPEQCRQVSGCPWGHSQFEVWCIHPREGHEPSCYHSPGLASFSGQLHLAVPQAHYHPPPRVATGAGFKGHLLLICRGVWFCNCTEPEHITELVCTSLYPHGLVLVPSIPLRRRPLAHVFKEDR